MTQEALMLRVRCVTTPDGLGNRLLPPPGLSVPRSRALSVPGLRDYTVIWLLGSMSTPIFFRLKRVPSCAIPEPGASWLTWPLASCHAVPFLNILNVLKCHDEPVRRGVHRASKATLSPRAFFVLLPLTCSSPPANHQHLC